MNVTDKDLARLNFQAMELTDQWAEWQPVEPTREQMDAMFVRHLLTLSAPLYTARHIDREYEASTSKTLSEAFDKVEELKTDPVLLDQLSAGVQAARDSDSSPVQTALSEETIKKIINLATKHIHDQRVAGQTERELLALLSGYNQ